MDFEPITGRLLAIATKPRPRAPMNAQTAASISVERGLEGDCRGRSARRQVTVLSREAWASACADLEADLPWTARRANLLVDSVPLAGAAGSRIQIGDLILEITGETRPCERMDEARPGLRAALTPDWRGGVTCRVIEGGCISVGDRVSLLPPESPRA